MGYIRQIFEFSKINGVYKDPGSGEHGKFLQWNNTTKKFDYVLPDGTNISVNTKTINGIVPKGDDAAAGNYVWKLDANKNPLWRPEEYLDTITRIGNVARFTMNSGATKNLNLGALAWLDSVDASIDLPGDTKVLYDANNVLSGANAFKYNYATNKLNFQGTSLNFDTTSGGEGIYKEFAKYLGNYSFAFASGNPTTASGAYNLIGGFNSGRGLGSTSARNTLYGSYTGEYMATNSVGNVAIGAYSGRYETGSNKLFVDNTDYLDTATARTNSFLYADLDTERRLYIRDRLAVVKEGKFGTSGLADGAGEVGMFQMAPVSAGVVKPQYYSNGIWNDFASSVDTYLTNVEYSGGGLTFTLSDASTIGPIDISGVNTITFATSPSSPATGKTATSNYGYLQISDTSFTNNEGFTHKAGLLWNNSSNRLEIPGGLKLTPQVLSTAVVGGVVCTAHHIYWSNGNVWYQLDNEPTSGQANELGFAGSVATNGDITLPKNGVYLPVKGLKPTTSETRLTITDNDVDKDLDFELQLDIQGNSLAVGGSPSTYGTVYRDTTASTGTDPRLNFRQLVNLDGTVVITQVGDEVRLSATTGGTPISYTSSNVGTGIGVFKQLNTSDFEFKSITAAGQHVTIAANVDGNHIDIDVDDLSINNSGESGYILSLGTDTFELTQKKLIAGTGVTLTDSTNITLAVTPKVPYFPTTDLGSTFLTSTYWNSGTKVLSFAIAYDDDVREGDYDSYQLVDLFNIKLGDGLQYNELTSEIYSTISSGGTVNDYSLRSVTIDSTNPAYHTLSFIIDNQLGTDSQLVDTVNIPKYGLAQYTGGTAGAVTVDISTVTNELNTQDLLTLDELTGDIGIPVHPVTYNVQNNLKDTNNSAPINALRVQARANIGAAYVNGSSTESFNANDLTVAGYLNANNTSEEHDIGGININDNEISADGGILNLTGSSSGVQRIVQSGNETKIVLDSAVNGVFTIYNSSGVKLLQFDKDGNLYIKGKIFADGEIEAFSDDTTV